IFAAEKIVARVPLVLPEPKPEADDAEQISEDDAPIACGEVTVHAPPLNAGARQKPSHLEFRLFDCSIVRCSMFDVRCSMFDVRCSMFDVRCSMFDCSMFDVRCSMFDVRFGTARLRYQISIR